jgi:N-methylhydantoinase A/oxoprolinase/acetone carboxylase beta subunit
MVAGKNPLQYRFAFDIGGTFTDLVLLGSDGSALTAKVLTAVGDVVMPIRTGLLAMLKEHSLELSQVTDVVVGATTAVTNLVIERKGAVTGLITTAGFRDVLEIARELRYDLYDLTTPGPDPIVPRGLRLEVQERVDASGAVVQALDDADVERVVRQLKEAGVKAIAVCLLHSYANSSHEQRIKTVIQRVAPELCVSLSSEVLGEMREYERSVATVLNACVMPMVGNYLGAIEDGLRQIGMRATLHIMQSNGGVISRQLGERMPIRMLESGPAAGALGAAYAARLANTADVMAFDMGGTTAKACLISNGRPSITTEFEAARQARFKKGSGLPVRLPTVDLIEIGAGGGSIAHVDTTGLLKVGPHSAGSSPGPACYGLGGERPTVTDAALVLGYLEPQGTLSGAVRLRLELAERAIKKYVADPLGISVVEAANGIHRIVCEHMAVAAKIHAVENGRDIRRYTLLAFGGAGPIHAREVARRSGCKEILVPANAGVFSAFGLLVAPMKMDLVRTKFVRLADMDWAEIDALLEAMEDSLCSELATAGIASKDIQFRRSADMRYVGQGFEVETELPTPLIAARQSDIEETFAQAYAQRFGGKLTAQRVEAVNWRVEGAAPAPETVVASGLEVSPSAPNVAPRMRSAFFPDLDVFVDTPVMDIRGLRRGEDYLGPALIEQPGSTVVIGPGDRFRLDEHANLRITLGAKQGHSA